VKPYVVEFCYYSTALSKHIDSEVEILSVSPVESIRKFKQDYAGIYGKKVTVICSKPKGKSKYEGLYSEL
jgi:hypothetical protein